MIGNGESRMGHLLIWKIYYLDPEPKVKPADLENSKLRKASNGAKPVRCCGGFVEDLAEARVGGGGLGGPVGGWAVRPSWPAGSGISQCSE